MDLQEQLQRAFVELGLARPGLGVEPKTTDKAISLARGAIYAAQQALAAPQPSQGAEDPYHEHSIPPVKRVGKPAVDAVYLKHLQAQEGYRGEHERAAYVADLLDTFEQLRQILGTPEQDADALIAAARRLVSESVAVSAAPMPQPEPTSKGACDHSQKEIVSYWACVECGHVPAFDSVPSSQQREPQEAAEREAQLQEAREQGWRAAIDVHSRHGMAGWSSHKDAALSAPQEASKPAPKQFYIKNIGGAFDEWEEIPASKEAGKVEPVADEPVAWQERQQTKDGWTDWYNVKAKTAMGKGPGFCEIIGGIKYQWRPLYLRPTQQALSVLVDSFRRRAIIPQSRMSELAQGRISAFEAAADELAAILAAAGGSEK